MNRRVMCTIIAKNYLAFARTLCQSFLMHHPEGECYVLIIDEWRGFVDPVAECFKIVSVSDLPIPNLPSFCFKYKLIELSTAVKPFLLEYLLSTYSLEKVLYFDPDILIMQPVDGLYDALSTHDMVLIPHLDADYPEDKHIPADVSIMRAGIFNLGFFGIRSSEIANKFLVWWKTKLYDRCLDAAGEGYFLDQKFLDYALILFPGIYVERGVGYDMAYWNIHSRRLNHENGQWQCNGVPLYFFHFSGYRPTFPDRISKHITRQSLIDRPDLRPLFEEYRRRLYANGYEETRGLPYTYATFKSGRFITNGFRRYYMNLPDQGEEFGNPFESKELEKLLARLFRFRWPLQLLYDYFQIYRIEERVKIFK